MPWPDHPLAATYHSALQGLQGRLEKPGFRSARLGEATVEKGEGAIAVSFDVREQRFRGRLPRCALVS